MAMPVTPTPMLKGREANKFFKVVCKGLENPASFTPTPNLDQARKIVKNDAAAGKK